LVKFNRFKNKIGPVAFNSAVHEDLGMIEYLFIDKTGTITNNEVELKILMIGDMTYGN